MKALAKREKFFVYMFVNVEGETLYVGKTKNLTGRIRSTHFTNSGHLPDECYDETEKVVYSECLSESDMTVQERYLINTLAPKYNDRLNRKDTFSFRIDCFDWKYLPIIRPEERPKKSQATSGLLTFRLPDVAVGIKSLAVPSLAEAGTLPATRDDPGNLYHLYSLGAALEPLRGLRMNGELWLSALSICEFSFISFATDNSSKIRIIQMIKKGFLTCDDICIVENKGFRRNDYLSSRFGKAEQNFRPESGEGRTSAGILIRAKALAGFVRGLLERETRDARKRLDKGASIRALYRGRAGDFPERRCKTYQEYCDFMAGPDRNNTNIFAVASWIGLVQITLSGIGPS